MNRRQFLQNSLGATVAVPLFADMMTAQGPAPASPAAAATRQLVLDAHSKSLQWIRSADEVAEAAIEMVCGGVCPTVLPYPGHINPASIAQELPAFVNRLRSHGLRVTQIKGPAIIDVTEPGTETIIGAAAQTGCTHYSLGGYTYNLTRPLAPQLDAIKSRIERFVRLNQKHNITLVYDTLPGASSVGGVVLDLLSVMKEFDPKYVGFHWDTGHMALHGDGMWETLMRMAAPYVATIGWRDRAWVQDLGLLGEGGPYAGPYPRVEPLVTQPDGSAVPGSGAAAGAGGGRRGGGGRGGGGGRAAAEAAPPANVEPGEEPGPGAAAPGRGRGDRAAGPARGPANSAGAGSIDDNNPLYRSANGEMPKRPIGGKNAKGGGWSAPYVAMGTGVVHIPRVAALLAEIGFNGPMELQSEYAGIGGAETGADRITRPHQFVIGMLKRDVITIRKSFEMANAGLTI
jgi:sugar phosphate isomerase/epimerase